MNLWHRNLAAYIYTRETNVDHIYIILRFKRTRKYCLLHFINDNEGKKISKRERERKNRRNERRIHAEYK